MVGVCSGGATPSTPTTNGLLTGEREGEREEEGIIHGEGSALPNRVASEEHIYHYLGGSWL